jgi:hypothetical protein
MTRALQAYLGHKNIQHTVRYTEPGADPVQGFLARVTMRAKADPVSEIQSLFLEKDEIGNMMLDNVLAIIADRPR